MHTFAWSRGGIETVGSRGGVSTPARPPRSGGFFVPGGDVTVEQQKKWDLEKGTAGLNRIFLGPKSGHVYLMEIGESRVFKVGCSTRPFARLLRLRKDHPDLQLRFVSPVREDKYAAERLAHRYFERFRIRGEWFLIPESSMPLKR